MSAGSSSGPPSFDAAASELGGVLREVVGQIRAVPAPPDLATRLIERAAAWSHREQVVPDAVAARPGPIPARAPRWALALAAALAVVVVGVVAYWMRLPAPPVPAPVVAVPSSSNSPTPTNTAREVAQVSTKSAGTTPRGAGFGLSAGASPCPFHAVAADAPVLVSTGGDKPIRLGDRLPYVAKGTLHVWDWSKDTESRPLKVTTSKGMAVSPDGKWVVTRDGQLIDTATSAVKKLDNFDGDVHGLKFSPDGSVLLLTVNQANDVASARVLEFPSARKRFEIEGQWSYTFAGAFTPDGTQFFLMDKDRFVHRWDAKTGKELGRYEPALTNSSRAIAVSADAKRVAAAGTRGDIHLWELAGGKLLHTLDPGDQPDLTVLTDSDSLVFSPDGRLLAGGSFLRLVLWDTDSGKPARLLPSSSGGAAHVRFGEEGKKLTTVHEFYGTRSDKGDDLLIYPAVRHWDVETGKELK
jgi:WD40 repeat protein